MVAEQEAELLRLTELLIAEIHVIPLDPLNNVVMDYDLTNDTDFTKVCVHLAVTWKRANNGHKKDFYKLRRLLTDIVYTHKTIRTLKDLEKNPVIFRMYLDRQGGIGEKTIATIYKTFTLIGLNL
jgi:hypothetical protein